MDKIIALSLTLFLCGCQSAWWHRDTRIVYVDKPVFSCPANYVELQKPTKPILTTSLLTKTDAAVPGKVVQAYAVDVRQLINYSEQLEYIVNAGSAMCSTNNK